MARKCCVGNLVFYLNRPKLFFCVKFKILPESPKSVVEEIWNFTWITQKSVSAIWNFTWIAQKCCIGILKLKIWVAQKCWFEKLRIYLNNPKELCLKFEILPESLKSDVLEISKFNWIAEKVLCLKFEILHESPKRALLKICLNRP